MFIEEINFHQKYYGFFLFLNKSEIIFVNSI